MRIAIRKLIGQLKRFEISLRDVPEEFSFHKDILAAEREFGHRKEGNRGYDAIHGYFFVEEDIFFKNLAGELKSRKRVQKFDSIEEYYDFLDGDIYDRACYRFCDFAKYRSFLKEKKINISLLKERKSFLSETIDDVCISVSEDEIREYDEAEINKSLIIQWIDRFDQCKSGSELDSVVDEYWKTRLFEYIDLSFFFYNYVFKDINDQDRFNAVMEYMCTGRSPENVMINELCLLYGADKVFEKYDYKSGSRGNIYKHKRKLKEFIAILDSNQIQFKTTYYFDKRSHFYCENIEGYEEGYSMPLVSCKRYFETFDELISYTNGSLKQTDLSAAIRLNVDFSKYETDETTKLPPINFENLECNIKKEYHEGKFAVSKEWHTKEGSSVKELSFVTPYFFDFVYYLRGDMSGANLLYCDGLENLKDYKGIDFSGAVMTSKMCEKFGVLFERYTLNTDLVKSFPITEKNERDTSITTTEVDTEIDTAEINMHALPLTYNYNRLLQRVYYITDLHLLHRLKNANCRSKEDVRYVIQKIVNNIVSDAGRLILIGGDVSSDFSIYNLFVKLLRERIDREKYKEIEVVFVLGNHELWDFQGKKVDEIVNIYRKTIEENGMILLHNEILYGDSDDNYCKLSYEKLMSYSINELRRRLLSTRMVILGGAAFSGYNDEFNANNGIYRETLDRKGEVAESMKFEDLFKRVAPAISDTNTVILTHTPQKDWASDSRPLRNVVYVNGHTHRNEFYDDGDYRIYSDNQAGYNKENPHLKSFIIDGEYDCFTDYEDGIYEITGEQYNDFYRGKNIIMDFTRDVNILYMLKKQGYYCFIHKSKKGLLSILNGGALKRLEERDVNYYYLHMDEMISYIKGPLDKFMSLMDKVSEDIKKIGGWGYVHGCIVDIDYYNHIYVNPNDLTLTGYWAYDMVEKFVYPNIPSLLKAECPEVYGNYIKYIGESKNALIIGDLRDGKMKNIRPKEYLSTDIYKTSREIKRMQKLRSNILSSWYEDSNKKSKSNLNDKKLNSSVYDKGIIKKKTVVLQGDTVDSQNENERLKHICGLKGNLSVSDNNEIRFRQWLTDDRFIDKVIEEYVADVKATVNDHGKTLFEMKSYDEIEEYIKQNEGKCTPKGRAAFKYYKRCMKEEKL